ncbi:hypothetical protein 8014-B2_0056 [Lactobacillus phage ATCC 8014-B2]|uniref:Uncharacterized protein n=1 Tax=Lactobacillus phage ATCC 8014-B2 TaxID=1225795 RepID=K4I0G1_9CAUD|nr:hypothetical protein HOQ89_gp090 [Lactobacillus phage ATCC 8014-B2]AFU63123.1 hypothetical protein 8014-B2_0056 [Lactobacillus phage ATCC 8014-B2]
MKDSAISGHYCLDIHGRLFNNKADLYDNQAKMLKDISENQLLYASNFKRENLRFEIETHINPLPADPLGDKEGYFKDIYVNIDWSSE